MKKGFALKVILLLLAIIVISFAAYGLKYLNGGSSGTERSFFSQFIIAGGPIVWFVLIPLSVLTSFVIIDNFFATNRSKLVPVNIGDKLAATVYAEGFDGLSRFILNRDDIVSIAVSKAMDDAKKDPYRVKLLMEESLYDQSAALLRKVEWLNLIGNVSPMVGLFGTVFGMIKLFNTIVMTGGQPQPAQLADGISVALVTTFWGLFIAIPAIAFFGIFKNKVESIISDALNQTEPVIPEIRKCFEKQGILSASTSSSSSQINIKKNSFNKSFKNQPV